MSPIRMSKIEAAVRAGMDFIDSLNRRDIAHLKSILSDDCVLESSDPCAIYVQLKNGLISKICSYVKGVCTISP